MITMPDFLQLIGFALLLFGVYSLVRASGFLNKENPVYKFYIKIGVILTPIGGIILVMGLLLSYL